MTQHEIGRRRLLRFPLFARIALSAQPAKKRGILSVEADMFDAEWAAGGLRFKALQDGFRAS
jgi:hypothetical protein